jgi:protein BCP1
VKNLGISNYSNSPTKMSKRRVDEDSDIDVSSSESEGEIENVETGENEEEEIVNVDFDYFDLNPEVDFLATKTFLTQLFGDDATNFDISSLADLILTKNSVGTTIKTEGQESDPFAILSVINISENLSKPCVKTLVDYIFHKTSKQTEFNLMLRKLLAKNSKLKTGLIISERMINMPVEVVPPMYKMLFDEMEKAEDAHEKYEFDYFLVISKIYKLVTSTMDDEDKKAKKKKTVVAQEQMDYFHYEDIILEEHAAYNGFYNYDQVKQETDSRRVFTEYGIDPKLSLILIDKDKLKATVPLMEEKFPPF